MSKDAFCIRRQRTASSSFLDRVSQLGAANISHQYLVAAVFDDRETLKFVIAQQGLCLSDRQIRSWQGQWIVRHNPRDRHVEYMVLLVIQEGESVKPDRPIGNATFSKAVTDGFSDANNNLNKSGMLNTRKVDTNSPW